MNKENLAASIITDVDVDDFTLTTGDIADFPSAPFHATVSPVGEISNKSNSEIVLVEGVTGDVVSVQRAQYGTTEQDVQPGWVIGVGVYVEDIDAKADTTALIEALPTTVGANGKIPKSNGTTITWEDDNNTTYSEITTAEIDAGTSTTLRTMTGRRSEYIVTKARGGRNPATDGTKLDGIEAGADVTDATNVAAAGAVMETDTSTVDMDFVVDEDDMASDSATKVPTQQSVKKYVDDNLGLGGKIADAYTDINGTPVMVIGHRGAPNMVPEASMAGYKSISAAGCLALEADAWLLKDGSLGIMHDSTLDRTTNVTGNTADQTSMSWKSILNDHGASLGARWTSFTESIPLLEEFVKEYGNKVTMVIEGKNTGACDAIVALLEKHNVAKDAAIIQSFTLSELAGAVAAGYSTMMLGASINPSATAAAGVEFACIPEGGSSAYVASLTAVGLKVGVYTVNRQYIRDIYMGYGATFFFSNDPIYLSGRNRINTSPFGSQTWNNGHLADGITNHRGVFNNGNRWEINNNERAYVLQGWGSPVGGNPTNNSFTVTFQARFTSAITATRWLGIAFMDKDWDYDDSQSGAVSGMNGYHCLFRSEGNMQIYKFANNGSATLLVDQATTAPSLNVDYTFTLTVTPSTITWQRTGFTAATTNDTSYRGGYIYLTHRINPTQFYNVTFTDT